MKVIITDYAETQLKDIFNYYVKAGYQNYGFTIRANLIRSMHRLASFPKLGKIDEDNLGKYSYRYLIEGVYRIYYRLALKEEPPNSSSFATRMLEWCVCNAPKNPFNEEQKPLI